MKSMILTTTSGYDSAVSGIGETTMDREWFFKHPEDFMLVLFTGGADVNPELYGDVSDSMCYYSKERDAYESDIFFHALKNNIKMTGICRGSQFINVMSGGKMMHDINGHGGGSHNFQSTLNNSIIEVNSFHHQMVIPPKDGIIMGWAVDKLSDVYYGNHDKPVAWEGPEVEAVLVPRTQCCGVQYHPEAMEACTDGYKFYHKMVCAFLDMPINHFTQVYTQTLTTTTV